MVDVKLTETDLPWFFKPVAKLWSMGAKCRSSTPRRGSRSSRWTPPQGALPVGVPDVESPQGRARWFVNENTGDDPRLDAADQGRHEQRPRGLGQRGAPLPVNFDAADDRRRRRRRARRRELDHLRRPARGLLRRGRRHAGVRPALEGHRPRPRLVGGGLGRAAERSRSFAQRDAGATGPAPTPTSRRPPRAARSACGRRSTSAPATRYDGRRQARPRRSAARPTPLTYDASTGTLATADHDPARRRRRPGRRDARLGGDEGELAGGKTTARPASGNKCTGTFGVVQRAFSASDARSGPIKVAQVLENGVAVGELARALQLRADELHARHGRPHRRQGQPAERRRRQTTRSSPCASSAAARTSRSTATRTSAQSQGRARQRAAARPTAATPARLPGAPRDAVGHRQPWHCVAVQTGVGDRTRCPAGMNERILGDEKPTTCTAPNNWASYPNLPAGDPRIVQVFLTPFGTFQGSGNDDRPGHRLRDLLRHRLDRSGTASPTPARATATTPCPTTTPATSSATSSSTSTRSTPAAAPTPATSNALGSCVAATDPLGGDHRCKPHERSCRPGRARWPSPLLAALLAAGVLLVVHAAATSSTLDESADPVTVLVAKDALPEGQLRRPDRQEGPVPGHRAQARAGQGGRDHRPGEPARAGGHARRSCPASSSRRRTSRSRPTRCSTSSPSDHRAITVPLDSAHGMIGQVQAGDHVDVSPASRSSPTAPAARGRSCASLLQNVEVLEAPAADDKAKGGLARRQPAAERRAARPRRKPAAELAFSSDNGKVWVVAAAAGRRGAEQAVARDPRPAAAGHGADPVDRVLGQKRDLIDKVYKEASDAATTITALVALDARLDADARPRAARRDGRRSRSPASSTGSTTAGRTRRPSRPTCCSSPAGRDSEHALWFLREAARGAPRPARRGALPRRRRTASCATPSRPAPTTS